MSNVIEILKSIPKRYGYAKGEIKEISYSVSIY